MPNRSEEERQSIADQADKMFLTTPDAAAKTIIKGIRAKKTKILVGPDARVIDYLQRSAPTTYDKVIARLFPRPGV